LTIAAVAALFWGARGITEIDGTTELEVWTSVLVLGLLMWASETLSTGTFRAIYASISGVVTVAAYLIAGPSGAVLVAAFTVFIWNPGRPLIKRIYNASQAVLDTFAGGLVYTVFLGERLTDVGNLNLVQLTLGTLAAYATMLLVNAVLLSIVVKLDSNVSPREVLRAFAPTLLPILGYGLLGVLLAVLWVGGLGAAAAPFMLLPLFVARWAFAQVEAEQASHTAAIHALAKMVETKDLYTRGHSERVSEAVLMLGQVLELEADRLQALGYAGLLHDVGKVGVPLSVLRKSGALTDAEMDEIKRHPTRGVELVGDINFLGEAHRGILHHHERFDGSGYPSGLTEMDIPEFARIISVADAFDSMTTSRSYRGARSVDEARAELVRCRGTHFDPRMVDAFVTALERFGWKPVTAEFAALVAEQPITIDHDDLSGVGSVPETAAADPAELAMSGAGGGPQQAP
jgi:HD-GYP domain-containing protein (c-di-GMP phosphodiesterase class II)